VPSFCAPTERGSRAGRTVYDSLYIALSMHEGCRFVTADERLVNGLGGTPYRVHAAWLGTM
jgi:predicted nucleic acid-binding protein